MQSIKSDLLSVKDIKTQILDNKYYEFHNLLDIINISNDLYHFLKNPLLNSKKKYIFLYIIFHLESFSSIIFNYIQFNTLKKSINTIFMKIWKIKKKWVQINVITAIPLRSSMEEYLINYFKNSYKTIKFFLKKRVNNNIIGGLILRIEDKELDNSLEKTIKILKIYLKNYI